MEYKLSIREYPFQPGRFGVFAPKLGHGGVEESVFGPVAPMVRCEDFVKGFDFACREAATTAIAPTKRHRQVVVEYRMVDRTYKVKTVKNMVGIVPYQFLKLEEVQSLIDQGVEVIVR